MSSAAESWVVPFSGQPLSVPAGGKVGKPDPVAQLGTTLVDHSRMLRRPPEAHIAAQLFPLPNPASSPSSGVVPLGIP